MTTHWSCISVALLFCQLSVVASLVSLVEAQAQWILWESDSGGFSYERYPIGRPTPFSHYPSEKACQKQAALMADAALTAYKKNEHNMLNLPWTYERKGRVVGITDSQGNKSYYSAACWPTGVTPAR